MAIETILSGLRMRPFEAPRRIPDALWSDAFFIGIFYNVTRYWCRVQYGREPTTEEFVPAFTSALFEVSGSKESAQVAFLTFRDAVIRNGLGSDFFVGAQVGLIYVGLITDTHQFDDDPDVVAALTFSNGSGDTSPSGVAGAYFYLKMKREFERRYPAT